jgi:hypothetical protein
MHKHSVRDESPKLLIRAVYEGEFGRLPDAFGDWRSGFDLLRDDLCLVKLQR